MRNTAYWSCRKCGENGTVPLLPGATDAQLAEGITRGHERRGAECHEKHGADRVYVIKDEKTLHISALRPEVASDLGREVSRR